MFERNVASGLRDYWQIGMNSLIWNSYDDKSWFGKGYIYRNYILPIFLVGLNLSTCFMVPAGRLYGSYWSGYGFFCLPYSILFVIAASNIGPQTPLDLGRCDAYGLVTFIVLVWCS
ncbi:hypothetical protein Tco_1547521 [Tanacetum coccineum]